MMRRIELRLHRDQEDPAVIRITAWSGGEQLGGRTMNAAAALAFAEALRAAAAAARDVCEHAVAA